MLPLTIAGNFLSDNINLGLRQHAAVVLVRSGSGQPMVCGPVELV